MAHAFLMRSGIALLSLVSAVPGMAQHRAIPAPPKSPAARVYVSNPVAISNAYTCQAGRYSDAVRCNAMYGSSHYVLGQVIPVGVGQPIGYAQLTPELRSQYSLDPARDYVLLDSYLLEVDPHSRAIRAIVPVQRQR